MTWSEGAVRKKGSQGTLVLWCLTFFVLFTLAHTSPRSKKVENDLVFEDNDGSELNLILSESKKIHRNRHENVKTHSEKLSPWTTSWSNRNPFQWSNNEEGDSFGGSIHQLQPHMESGKNPQALKKRKAFATTASESSSKRSTSSYDLGRRRSTRVSETDDEDLIYSGEGEEEGSGFGDRGTDIQYPTPTGRPFVTTSRTDDSFDRRFFRITLTIAKSWSPALQSNSSSTYKLYLQELEREVAANLGLDIESFNFIMFENIQDPAFVRCIFDLGLIGVSKEQLEEEFETYLEVGSMGSLRIKNEAFSVRDVGAPADACQGQLECRNGNCVDLSKRCNFIRDCGPNDDTDEQGCAAPSTTPTPQTTTVRTQTTPRTARPRSQLPNVTINREGCRADDQVRCSDGSSVLICFDQICDGIKNCPAGEDETPEKCRENTCPLQSFQCDLTKCISEQRRCDGRSDCADGSDELNCDACDTKTQFKCDSGYCIPIHLVCDQLRQCNDGSDESDLACRTKNTTQPGRPGTRPPPEPVQCSSYEFKCNDGSSCIERSLECDGIVDCRDGSDEESTKCSLIGPACDPRTQFKCDSGYCIPIQFYCNGRRDCLNGNDEGEHCRKIPCTQDQFRCSDAGGCIPKTAVCNGIAECESLNDEKNCSVCKTGEFRCDNGICLPSYLKCNGRIECSRGEDEENCRVTPPPNPQCNRNQFTCLAGSTRCIDIRERCNNRFECQDGSDELNCPSPTTPRPPLQCKANEFQCRQSKDQCILLSGLCNGVVECNDFSDEQSCENVISPGGGLNLKTYPSEQTIRQGHEVVFQCRDEGPLRVPVRWTSGNGLGLPPGSRDFNGRLEMPNVTVEQTGTYICEAIGYPLSTSGARVSVYLRVDQSAGKSPPWSPSELSHYDFWDNSQWQTINFPKSDPLTYPTTDIDQPPPTRPPSACGINQATCNSGECISKHMICNSVLDCEDGSDEQRCRGTDNCEPNEFMCANKRCLPKSWICDSDDDCGDNSDEASCPTQGQGSCRSNEYSCASGNQCIPKAFHCDKELDCSDRSDEMGCSVPVIQRPPPPLINVGIGQWFNVSCTTVGQPIPEVVWRLNWGHIPSKCITSSINGVGYLSCPDIQITDQGAYSCEAINVLGSTFAIPDCILIVERAPSVCSIGSFNDLAETSRDCLSCFCFGHTTDCSSTKLYISQMPPPEFNFRIVGVSQDLLGSGQVEIQDRSYVIPPSVLRNSGSRGIQASISNIRTLGIPEDIIPYFALPPSYNGNLLKAFGGYLRYNLRYRGSSRPLRAPDVIINGNGVTLLHVRKEPLFSGRDNSIAVRFWAGEWFKRVLGKPGGDQPAAGVEPASREEILMVLASVEYFLIRAQYDQTPSLDTTLSNVKLDYALANNAGLGVAIYVEECRCPTGYIGISCEGCAPGFERHQQGPWLGMCMKTSSHVQCPSGTYSDQQQCKPCPCPHEGRQYGTSCYKDTDNQVTCNCNAGHIGRNCSGCAPGYQQSPSYPYDCRPIGTTCDEEGSLSPYPDPVSGRCVCKELVTGTSCNSCKDSTFFLSGRNKYGCISCFCMGVTNNCQASGWYRTQEISVFVNSALGYTLVDESQRNVIRDGFAFDSNSRELGFKQFNRYPTDIYYWQLPYNYLGNKVTSYGGYLNYTVRYVPPPGGQNSPNTAADVEINGNDIRLLYFRKVAVPSNKPVEISVPFVETYWQRQDGQLANREHLLMALANLDALLVKATYTTSTREAHISNVKMDYAVQRNTGFERAYAVEQCACPLGYDGLSCEECSFGYTRSLRGLYLGLCEPCSCNGHSDECDPKTGVCRNCRDYTAGDFCELCESGYERVSRNGTCRPTDAVRCACDPRGSQSQSCPDGRNCLCKGNVEGHTCNICRRGTFALQEVNPQGCLECHCGGVTSECSSAKLYRSVLSLNILAGPHGITLTDNTRTLVLEDINVDLNTGELSYVFPYESKGERLFWSLPAQFTGNRLTSYGGKLRATRRYSVQPGTDESALDDVDVILTGNNGVSLFWIYGIRAAQEVQLEVSLRETAGWRHLEGANRIATREDILGILADVQFILIRATFTDNMKSTFIKDISLDDAVKHFTPNGLVVEVEECNCGENYVGLSCQSCSPGYYRDPNNRSKGPRGACLPCPCGVNAEGCRYESGRVLCICKPGYSGTNCDSRVGETIGTRPTVRPTVTISPRYSTVRMNEAVEFQCAASGFPVPSVSWSTSRGPVPSHISVQGSSLRISAARSTDAMEYICTARNIAGTETARAILYVQGGSPAPILPPVGLVVSITPTSYEARPGETVRFRCDSSDRNAQVQWSKLSGVLPQTASQTPDGLLTLYSVRDVDAGIFSCISVSESGQSTQAQARLSVSIIQSPPSAKITPERQTVSQGNPIEIRCIPTGNPTPTIEWTKVGGSLPRNVQRNNELLRIESADINDRGVFVCEVENSGGKSLASAIVEVERREAPQIEMYPKGHQSVVRDGSALFQCRVTAGIPSPIVSWSRGDGRGLPRTVEEIEGGVLRFNRVTGEEGGQYICKAENLVGTSTAIATLNILIPPNITITPSSPHRVQSGQSVRLECKAEGTPSPSVSWVRLQASRDSELPGAAGTSFSSVYDIGRVSKSDEGSYSCIAKSEAGEAEDRIQLLVDDANSDYNVGQTYYPTTRPREEVYYFPVGSRAELRCIQAFEGDVFDRLYLDWSRADGGRMPKDYDIRDGILYINELSHEDSGVFQCYATNRQGQQVFTINARLEVVGTSPPRIQLEPARQTVRRGAHVTINCIVSGEQPITINWYKMDRRPLPPSVLVNGPQLIFRAIEPSDMGRFVCSATNAGGNAESVAEVTVNTGIDHSYNGQGVIGTALREQKGFVGSTIDLQCGIGGSQFRWRKDDNEELPRTAMMLGPTLTLLNLQESDSGRYICETEEGTDFIDLSVDVATSRSLYCGWNEFLCISGDKCVPNNQRCDSVPNCQDYSDELNCSHFDLSRSIRASELVAVRIHSSQELLRVGDDLELRCDVQGDLQPQIRWSKLLNGEFEDNVQIFNNVLKIRDLRNENGGVYRCTASTTRGIINEDHALTIHANPDRIQNSAPIETRSVPYGSTVTMDCKTDLSGRIEYVWSKSEGVIHQQQVNGPSLTISDASAEDAGTYICTASTSPTITEDVTTVLVVTGAVPQFTQTPSSYMSLSTLPDSYLNFDIEIAFKPDARNGLILYNGQMKDGSGDFVSFGLSNGHPEFRFDVGSGPAVIRGDRILQTGKWHKVQLLRNQANGKMIIDNKDVFTGTVHDSFKGLDLMEPLFVGGHPNFHQVHKLAGHAKGFVGCISELVIGGKRTQLFKDSQTSRGVSSCDTCAANGCTNGGVCQEGLSDRGYSCICPLGYSGPLCNVAGQSCSIGSCGEGKCVNIPGGFECQCPVGKVGARCARDVVIYEPKLSSNSYMAYATPTDLKKLKVTLRVKPQTDGDGLLLYCSQTNNGLGDYTSLTIRDKRFEFQYDTGSGPALIRSKQNIVLGEWVLITIERNLQDGELRVGDELTKGKSPGITRGLNLKTPLYLGGVDRHRIQLNNNIGVVKGFTGCISKIDVSGMNVDLINSVLEGANIENCENGSHFCTKNPCKNGGVCEENTTLCNCQTGFSGRHCENRDMCSLGPCKNGGTCYSMKNSYRCSCAKSWFGKDCETAMGQWSHSVAFRGEGYIELDKSHMPRRSSYDPEKIEIEVSTTFGSGLLFWHGPSPSEIDPDDFFAIGINSEGKVELQWDYGTGTAKVVSNKAINDGQKHTVVLKRQGADGSIQVDGEEIPAFTMHEGPIETLNPRGNIYVGGVPNAYQTTHGKYHSGFIGCIHSLKILTDVPVNLNDNAISAVNTGPCSEGRHHERRPHHGHHNKHKSPNGDHRYPKRPNGEAHSKSRNEVTDYDDTEEGILEGRHRLS